MKGVLVDKFVQK